MVYEITTDCRIAGKEYKKGDLVTKEEVGQYFTTVMKPVTSTPKVENVEPVKAPVEEKLDDEKTAEVDEPIANDGEEIADENVEPAVEEKPEPKAKAKSKKK